MQQTGNRSVNLLRDPQTHPTGDWITDASSMNDPRHGACSAMINGQFYVAGGEYDRKAPIQGAEFFTLTSTALASTTTSTTGGKASIAHGTWTKIANMSRSRSYSGAAEWQNRFYVFGYSLSPFITYRCCTR
jgi:hypothetical protein